MFKCPYLNQVLMYNNNNQQQQEEKNDWRMVSIEMPLSQRDGVGSYENGPFMLVSFGCYLYAFDYVCVFVITFASLLWS